MHGRADVPAYTGRVKSVPAFEPWAKVAGARLLGHGSTTEVCLLHAHECTPTYLLGQGQGAFRTRSHPVSTLSMI